MAKSKTKSAAQAIAARKKQVDQALTEIVGAIDGYMTVAPVIFMAGRDASPNEYILKDYPHRFNKFDHWNERWMGALFPRTIEMQEKIVKSDHDCDDEYMTLCYDAQNFGFLLGFLMGCREMGANREQLLAKANGFTMHELGYAEWDIGMKSKGN